VGAYDEAPLWSAAFGLLLLEEVPLGPLPMRVLDLACGTGFPAIELAQRLGPTSVVHAVDIWTAALERARFKAGALGVNNIVFHTASAAELPFKDGEFDLITSNLGINNFDRRDAVVQECKRVLRPGGKLVFTTNLVGHMAEFYAIFREVLRDLDDPAAIAALDAQEQTRMTLAGTQALLTGGGFEIEKIEQRTLKMRFANGTALFTHTFVKLAFLDGWQSVAPTQHLEQRLNAIAAERGGLDLTVPMLAVRAKSPEK